MNAMHLSAECYPVAKVGGLGDVVGALPKYLCRAGINASVVLPYYDRKFVRENTFDLEYKSSLTVGKHVYHYQILKESKRQLGFDLFLIHIPGLLDRPEIYSYPDEIEQFISFQICFLDWIVKSDKKPDLIHCHDHHSGLVPFLALHSYPFKSLASIPTICTIHNAEYQGCLGWDKIALLPEFDSSKSDLLSWDTCINSLAASVKCARKFTTVSPSYLEELSRNSNGLEKLFQKEKRKGLGIINGIDIQVWDPNQDPMIYKNYCTETVDQGKKENKFQLCKAFGLNPEKPLLVFIGRLVLEKGADLLPEAINRCHKNFDGKLNILILGSGDPLTENALKEISLKHSKHFGLYIGYNEELAHRMYAGADFLLMPSRVEPCGLNQLYALRYGMVPIVHKTGGLKDTVIDLENKNGYGLTFDNLSIECLIKAIERAIELYSDQEKLTETRKKMMRLNFSWAQSSKEYIKLYKNILSG
ncbi:glycogen synthase [Daejeonella sp.]|jgi:starch synthase|uniref:glycogen synthase n=1 Tax=Daejeonella sp. TaxID=2805397 RepID=UPI0037850AB4